MDRRRVSIENIHISSRHREPDMAKVREIARSIADVGLMNPPAVVFRDGVIVDGETAENTPVLVYGRHRLLALQLLGEVTVECIVHDVDDLHAELMEIDENLARAELSPSQEAAHIRRRQEIWEEINQSKQVVPIESKRSDGRGHRHKEFAAELAEVTGSSKVDINRKLRRARELGDDTQKIANTSLDSGVEMDALIKLPKDQRDALIDRAAAGQRVSARQPEARPTPAADRAVSAIEALETIAGGIVGAHPVTTASPIAEQVQAADEAERKKTQRDSFWKFWASLDDDVREDLHAKLRAM